MILLVKLGFISYMKSLIKAFVTLKNYKAYVEKEIGAYITCLMTDRGGEFTSNEFGEFYQSQGISRQLMATYTSQQNRVAKRKNRKIMNVVWSMLNEKQVPKAFWTEAVRWCVHIQNLCPTLAVENKTPEEETSGRVFLNFRMCCTCLCTGSKEE